MSKLKSDFCDSCGTRNMVKTMTYIEFYDKENNESGVVVCYKCKDLYLKEIVEKGYEYKLSKP